jgi:hypothetical protein
VERDEHPRPPEARHGRLMIEEESDLAGEREHLS